MTVTDFIPECDGRKYDDIIKEIEYLAEKYTPEWKFSPDNPDAGTALACVFAHRMSETIERFNKMPLNHKRQFYNMLGASALPAVPASGYILFNLNGINESNSFIEKGFKLFSPAIDEQGTRLIYETQQSALITTAKIKEIIYADCNADLLCFCKNSEEKFEPSYSSSCNKRLISFRHDLFDNFNKNCRFYIIISGSESDKWMERLSDPLYAEFSQYSDEHETRIDCFKEGSRIRIGLTSDCDGININILNINEFHMLPFGDLYITSEGNDLAPDSILINEEFENKNHFYAFGESPSVYDNMYIESNAVFSKKGAVITLNFNLGFDEIDNGEIPEPVIPNKLFVRKKSIHRITRSIITVENVVWEYWNGYGFTPLKELNCFENIFSGVSEYESKVKTASYKLTFVCPSDISPVLIGADLRLCIRARIKRIKNAYALPSRFYVPWLENISISYKYDKPLKVTDIKTINNCEENTVIPVYPFKKLPSSSLYIGFDRPLYQGPFTLLICCGNFIENGLSNASWSYLTDIGWESLEISKENTSLTSEGFFCFYIPYKLIRSNIFGKTAYWIKAEISECQEISIEKILLNCVPVMQCESIESFCSDPVVETIKLDHKNIIELQIYINTSKRNEEEKWECLSHGWTLDNAEGLIKFSPKISLNPNSRTIKLKYCCGGGKAGNISAGQTFVPAISDGLISSAVNPFSFQGGTDRESNFNAEKRLSYEFRHQNRPVTKKDYEDFLIDDDFFLIEIKSKINGVMNIKATVSSELINKDVIKKRIYSKLTGILPIDMGEIRVKVVYRNE